MLSVKTRLRRNVPRFGTLDRDVWVREIARGLVERIDGTAEADITQTEQIVAGLIHYALGRVHDRPQFKRESHPWRGKTPIIPIIGSLLANLRVDIQKGKQPVMARLQQYRTESEQGKFNPHAAKTFAAASRLDLEALSSLLTIAERAVILEIGPDGAESYSIYGN